MRYPHHMNNGHSDSPEGSCELVNWSQVSKIVIGTDLNLG